MAGLSEDRIYEAFGISQEQREAAQNSESTEGNTEVQDAGERDQQPAEAEVETEAEDNEDNDSSEDTEDEVNTSENESDNEDDNAEQSPQQRHKNAARRRQAEQQAAIDRAVNDALTAEREKNSNTMAEFFQRAGLKNTISGAPITSLDEFESWQNEFAQQKLNRELEQGKLSTEGLETAISQHPVIKQAQELLARSEEEAKRQEAEVNKAQIDKEILEIQKMDPSIKSVEDLLKMPKAKEFYDYVSRGNNFIDAFKLVNFDKLNQRTAEAAKQQALNNARSKDHLSTGARNQGEGSLTVPKEEMKYFRNLMPDATDAEIQKYYNNYKK